MYNDGIRKYQETMVHTMGPERMIVMLYEGVVRHLQAARADLGRGEVAGKATHLKKARNIVAELRHSLDPGADADLAGNLSALYGYIFNELIEAQISDETRHIDDVLRVIAPLLVAWQSIPPGAVASAARAAHAAGPATGPEPASAPSPAPAPAAEPDTETSRELCVAV
ncbi:flagellar export chaperone FliS [bacterium]|nr:flagellar export chaperone FliS [bacterium]